MISRNTSLFPCDSNTDDSHHAKLHLPHGVVPLVSDTYILFPLQYLEKSHFLYQAHSGLLLVSHGQWTNLMRIVKIRINTCIVKYHISHKMMVKLVLFYNEFSKAYFCEGKHFHKVKKIQADKIITKIYIILIQKDKISIS